MTSIRNTAVGQQSSGFFLIDELESAPSSESMERWFVARAKPQKETYLLRVLNQYGVRTYYPRIVRPGLQATEPLFPGYLFCQFDPYSSQMPLIRWAPGIAYLLGSQDEPAALPHTLIEDIRYRVECWNSEGHQQRFTPGARVRVTRGPFAGLEGIFQTYVPAQKRCAVLLEMMGRLTRTLVAEYDLAGEQEGRA